MHPYPFSKKPAFFPFVSAEVFFEANETNTSEPENADLDADALDRELDAILGLTEVAD